MTEYESLIQILAKIMGAITLIASTMSAVLLSHQVKGRSSGRGTSIRNGLGILVMAILFVLIGIVLWKPIPVAVPSFITIIGAFFYFGGVGFYLWGLMTMRSQFAVSNLFGAELYKEHKLVTSGPFALVRHPLYVGVILTALGALLIFKTWAMVVFMPMSLVVIGRAEREERLLEQEFGEAWNAYSFKIPKWLPKLW